MNKIIIPVKVLPGFQIIYSLKEEQVDSFSKYLKSLPIGFDLELILEHLQSFLDKKDSLQLMQTLLSFTELIEPVDLDIENLANDLADAYQESAENPFEEEEKNTLKSHLFRLLDSYNSLKITLKSKSLIYDNENILNDAKIITDIRMIFNEKLEDSNRAAVVLQKLRINYQSSKEPKEIYFTLDMNDLNKLKTEIERAINKERIIREEYKDSITFLM